MTPCQAELFKLDQYEYKIDTTGGMDGMLFQMIARDNPELAKELNGKDISGIKTAIAERRRDLESIASLRKRIQTIPSISE